MAVAYGERSGGAAVRDVPSLRVSPRPLVPHQLLHEFFMVMFRQSGHRQSLCALVSVFAWRKVPAGFLPARVLGCRRPRGRSGGGGRTRASRRAAIAAMARSCECIQTDKESASDAERTDTTRKNGGSGKRGSYNLLKLFIAKAENCIKKINHAMNFSKKCRNFAFFRFGEISQFFCSALFCPWTAFFRAEAAVAGAAPRGLINGLLQYTVHSATFFPITAHSPQISARIVFFLFHCFREIKDNDNPLSAL